MRDKSPVVKGFLAMAKEAEKAARAADNPKIKEAWLRIAQSYRDLAEQIEQ